MSVEAAEISERLRKELPLTLAMGMEVTGWDGKRVTLVAPLKPNLNHTETAFGGSIACMGILAGYALLYLLLEEKGIGTKVVIQKSTTDYLRPIDTEIVSSAVAPGEEVVAGFLEEVKRKRRGRITLESEVMSGRSVAARHSGVYVAILY